MEELLPSEVARLILGFLKENKWEKSYKIFLEECSDLYEYNLLYKRGRLYSTNVNGKSLLDILKEYCTLKSASEKSSSIAELSENVLREKFLLEESVKDAVEQVIQKYLPCFCRKNHSRCDLFREVTQIDHTSDHNSDKSIVLELENESEEMGESNHSVIMEENDSKGSNDYHGSNVQSKSTDSDTNSTTEEIISKNFCKFGGSDPNLQSAEHSVPDRIYRQDIIKVEKDSENSTFLQHKSGHDCSKSTGKSNQTPSTDSENNLYCTKNKSMDKENYNKVVSIASYSNPNTVDLCKVMQTNNSSLKQTIKVEPDSSVNSINHTKDSNYSQTKSPVIYAEGNQSSLAEINETAFCSIQSTRGSVNNTANAINLVNSQSGYAIHSFTGQSLPVSNMSYQSLPTYFVPNCPSNNSLLQNNSQYSFIINTPATGTTSTLPVAIPSILPSNIGPTLTSVTSLRTGNPPSVLSISNNSLSNMNAAADSTNACEKTQTDSTAVLNSVCKAAEVLFAPTGQKVAPKSKPIRNKFNQESNCGNKDDLINDGRELRSKKKNQKSNCSRKGDINKKRQELCLKKKNKYEILVEWNKKQTEFSERSTLMNGRLFEDF